MKQAPRQVDHPGNGVKRRTIGFMTDGLYGQGGYHSFLWRGVRSGVRTFGLNLVCFTGGMLRLSPTYEYEYQRNTVYDLISKENIDGLIISGASISHAISQEELRRYCARFTHLPAIIVGATLDGIPSLLVNNKPGARQIVSHLIEMHGHRRIAYVRGPETSQDAGLRFEAYVEVLKEHGLPFDSTLVVTGTFMRQSGEDAVRVLIDERKVAVDAIVAANDNMALGVISALQSRGIQTPHDVTVVGFDDTDEAKVSVPSLTTVRQPIYEMGENAVALLLNRMDGETLPDVMVFPTELEVRHSCGCSLYTQPLRIDDRMDCVDDAGEPASEREAIIAQAMSALKVQPSQRVQAQVQAGQLLDAFTAVIVHAREPDLYLPLINMMMIGLMRQGHPLPWHRVAGLLLDSACRMSGVSANPVERAQMWPWLWRMVGELEWLSFSNEKVLLENRFFQNSEQLRGVSQEIVSSVTIPDLMEAIARQLPTLGLQRGWIALFDGEERPATQARLMMAFSPAGTEMYYQHGGWRYPAHRLVPEDTLTFNGPYELVVNALFYGDTSFGFAVYEIDDLPQTIIDLISSHISTALRSAEVFSELQHAEEELRRLANTDPLTGIYNRRAVFSMGETIFELARRHRRDLSVAMIDLDNFKRVNDTYGHSIGDQVLTEFVKCVQRYIRETDLFGRFGGEEFIIVLPETPLGGAWNFVERIRQIIEEKPISIGNEQILLSVSIGLAALQLDEEQTLDRLIDHADKALYDAKRDGKNRVVAYKMTM